MAGEFDLPQRFKPAIGCGMYAFTPYLRKSWTAFFNDFRQDASDNSTTLSRAIGSAELCFSTDDNNYFSNRSLIAHTCGYPYMKKWRDSHQPVCVPVFNIDGCEGKRYRSWFIQNKQCSRTKLENFQNTRVAINGWESNSGMNVLRYATSMLAEGHRFFSDVKVTGSHYKSMQAVAQGQADIAAVDAVSFYFAALKSPELLEQINIFDQSADTIGLPFIQRRDSRISPQAIIEALNAGIEQQSGVNSEKLRLLGFQRVTEEEYLPMLELERLANDAGYQTLA